VVDWAPPGFRWVAGAHINLSYNCLDGQVQRGRGGLSTSEDEGSVNAAREAWRLWQKQNAAVSAS